MIVGLLAAATSGLAVAQSDAGDLDEVTLDEESISDTDSGPSRFMAVRLGGGVEGYTGDLNDLATIGPTWGLTVDVTPWRAFNLELGYTGATAEVDDAVAPGEGLTSGPDIIRNGAHAALTLGPPTALQPYALAGIGVDYYRLRGELAGDSENDFATSLPLGVGLRGDLGRFSADLRVTYSALFGDTFAGQADNDFGDGRVAGALQLGGTF